MSNDSGNSRPSFPIAVGGLGGSGTRAVANVLEQLGYYLGGDLNRSKDNLWYTLLFKRRDVLDASDQQIERLVKIFSSAMSGRKYDDSEVFFTVQKFAKKDRHGHDVSWLTQRSISLQETLINGRPIKQWGWKEPNTHVLVERLAKHMPDLRYIHVVRDGLDMAFSRNKNQLHYWADRLFQMSEFNPDEPSAALRYWRLVNERIVRLRKSGMLPVLEVGFECLCERTTEQVLAIAEFCDLAISRKRAREIGAQTVRMPKTVGRHRKMDLTTLDTDDCRYARDTNARLRRALDARIFK